MDGSGLARAFFTPAALVGAAMCSAFERGTFWPLAIMPSADKSTHSMMLWPKWVVLIAGSDRFCIKRCSQSLIPFFPTPHVGFAAAAL